MDNSTQQHEQQRMVNKMVGRRHHVTRLFWLVIFLIAIIAGLYYIFIGRFIAYTDDCYVQGNQVYITPLIPGFVTAIHTDDTFLVKKGQLLVQLDTTDAEIALEHSKNELAKIVREVCQAFHQVFALTNELEQRKAELLRAAQDFQHRAAVLPVEGVSLEEFQHAQAALRATYYGLRATESYLDQSIAFVQGTAIRNHPLVLAAANIVRDKWVQLYRCAIYSPVDGLVAQRKIQVGMWIKAGNPLMSVIPLDQIWVNANYKETQMARMKLGQKVRITSDLYGSEVVYHGHIVGLPGAAGNAFSLLPPENLSGNWIKIVQRLPVRVALEMKELQEYPLRIGMSMEATVDLRDQAGLLVPTTSEGSPTYETPIFKKEEFGDEAFVGLIIDENLDPELIAFVEQPSIFEKEDLNSEITGYFEEMNIPLEELLF